MIEDYTFQNQTICIDYQRYRNCRFVNCQLVFNGAGPYQMENCQFEQTGFSIANHAALAAQFYKWLKSMPATCLLADRVFGFDQEAEQQEGKE